jgi:creatinine amidohydrolase
VPIGAAAKEHGPHLPLGTDYQLARALAERIAAALPVVVAPVVGFGYYPAFVNYPGSQHLTAATFIALVEELLGNLVAHGVSRIAIVNTGVSTEAPLQIAARRIKERTGVAPVIADIRSLGRGTRHLLEQKAGGHADEHETSLMLTIDPEAVRLDLAEPDYGHALEAPASVFHRPVTFTGDPAAGADYSKTGAFGDPTLATAEKGRAFLDAMANDLIEGLRASFPEAFEPRA